MDHDAIGAAFIAQLTAPHPVDAARLATELAEVVARARSEAPDIDVDPIAFAAYLAERVTLDVHGQPVLVSVRAGPLWIAYGCVVGDHQALAAFEAIYAPEITNALARSFDRGLANDAELRLRERLFLVGDDEVPRLASYSGRGDLRAWLRAAAVRTAIDLMRSRRAIAVDPADLDASLAIDPLLEQLKQRYRDEFRTAFRDAAGQLTDRERTLLRYRYVDNLSIDEIGALYRVHRATTARWLATIRETLFEETRSRLTERLELDTTELDSVLRLIDSQLEVSLDAVLG